MRARRAEKAGTTSKRYTCICSMDTCVCKNRLNGIKLFDKVQGQSIDQNIEQFRDAAEIPYNVLNNGVNRVLKPT